MARVAAAKHLIKRVISDVRGFSPSPDLSPEQREGYNRFLNTWVLPYLKQAIDNLDSKPIPWSEDLAKDLRP